MDGLDSYSRSPPTRAGGFERGHDRDRDRDGDRDAYRDNRRGQDRRRPARNRSRSPVRIDRYTSDRDRDDYYGGPRHRRRSSPRASDRIDRYVPEVSIPVNPMRDPLFETSQVGFSYFSEWWRGEEDVKLAKERQMNPGKRFEPTKESQSEQRARIQAAYDEYKLAWNARMAKQFVQAHKHDNWFRERYDPEVRDPLRAQVAALRKGLFEIWERDIDAGVFDDFTMEGIYKSESNGEGGVVEKEEGEATAAAEVLAVSDLVPAKGADLRDPVATLPTLLIKTITPAVSRAKVEEFCKEHLGDGTADGNFKWLSLSDPNPGKKFHRLGWVMLHSDASTDVGDDVVRRGSTADDETAGDAMDRDVHQANSTTQDKALALLNEKTIKDSERGDFTVHVGIHRTTETPRKKALWDLFSAPERIERDLSLAIRLVSKLDDELSLPGALMKIEERVNDLAGKGHLQPPAVVKSSNATNEDDEMEEGEEGEEAEEDELDDEDMIIMKKKLDLLVEYLRRVHNFCLFCVFETDSIHELQRKCVGGHLRRPRASLTTGAKEVARRSAAGEEFPPAPIKGDREASPEDKTKAKAYVVRSMGRVQLQKAFNWVKTYEEKLLQVLEPGNADLRKLGGRDVEEALEEELGRYVKQEDESKFRCKVPDCTKLFKGVSFWRKHVEKRHEEWFKSIKDDLELVNRYVLDPSRLALGRNDASSNGHFPVNNSITGGTPRNFSLNHIIGGGSHGMFSPMMGAYPGPAVGGYAMGGDGGGIGPMRNGMRGGGLRGAAPYDRSGGGRRGPLGNGRLSPPRGGIGGGIGRPPRPGFVEGGVGTFSSTQAIEGRSVKSYNDLDAAGPGINAESAALDY